MVLQLYKFSNYSVRSVIFKKYMQLDLEKPKYNF